mgnify:CR=1 FL=1
MEKETAEIANLVARYDRVQSLMKYVNNDTRNPTKSNRKEKRLELTG